MSVPLSPVLHAASTSESVSGLILKHWCPGCKMYHLIHIEKPNQSGASWSWDSNAKFPTVWPSVNIVGHCHYWLKAGKIEYCADSRHGFAGHTIDMPEIKNTPSDDDDDLDYLNDLDFGS